MISMKTVLQKLLGDQRGAAAAEYALILALIAGVVIAALTALGGSVEQSFQTTSDAIENAGN